MKALELINLLEKMDDTQEVLVAIEPEAKTMWDIAAVDVESGSLILSSAIPQDDEE